MGVKGWSFRCENPFFVYLRKHFCPRCGGRLLREKVSQIISSDASEAKNYDFQVADISVKGHIKFTHIAFFCPACGKHYTVKEIRGGCHD